MVLESDELLQRLPLRVFVDAVTSRTAGRDYAYYRAGCNYMRETPLSRWKFRVAFLAYERYFADLSMRMDSRIPWAALIEIADMVRVGREYATSTGIDPEDEDDYSGGMGVREPRRPLDPVLVGSGARPLPPVIDSPGVDYDRSMLY